MTIKSPKLLIMCLLPTLFLAGCAVMDSGKPPTVSTETFLTDLRIKANSDDHAAQFALGLIYENGLLLKPDPKQAEKWYFRARGKYARARSSWLSDILKQPANLQQYKQNIYYVFLRQIKTETNFFRFVLIVNNNAADVYLDDVRGAVFYHQKLKPVNPVIIDILKDIIDRNYTAFMELKPQKDGLNYGKHEMQGICLAYKGKFKKLVVNDNYPLEPFERMKQVADNFFDMCEVPGLVSAITKLTGEAESKLAKGNSLFQKWDYNINNVIEADKYFTEAIDLCDRFVYKPPVWYQASQRKLDARLYLEKNKVSLYTLAGNVFIEAETLYKSSNDPTVHKMAYKRYQTVTELLNVYYPPPAVYSLSLERMDAIRKQVDQAIANYYRQAQTAYGKKDYQTVIGIYKKLLQLLDHDDPRYKSISDLIKILQK